MSFGRDIKTHSKQDLSHPYTLVDTEMHYTDPFSKMGLLPSSRECGQQMAISCWFFQGLPLLHRAALPKVMLFLGQPISSD